MTVDPWAHHDRCKTDTVTAVGPGLPAGIRYQSDKWRWFPGAPQAKSHGGRPASGAILRERIAGHSRCQCIDLCGLRHRFLSECGRCQENSKQQNAKANHWCSPLCLRAEVYVSDQSATSGKERQACYGILCRCYTKPFGKL